MTRVRRGGRGCPSCGSHETKQLGKTEQICRDCDHTWAPCAPFCRGYLCDVHHEDGPTIAGCAECGVPTRIARHWPEAWRALARELDHKKFSAVALSDPPRAARLTIRTTTKPRETRKETT